MYLIFMDGLSVIQEDSIELLILNICFIIFKVFQHAIINMVRKANGIFSIIVLIIILSSGICSCITVTPRPGDEPTGGKWKTIVLESGDSIRLDPPPTGSIQQAEVQKLLKLQSQRTPKTLKTIEFWDQGASVRWNEIARNLVVKYKTDPPMASRIYALLSIAQYDALIAAWNNKYYYNRASPGQVNGDVFPEVATTTDPVYPSEAAVVASASAEVLEYVYPDEADYLDEKVKEHEESRLWAGVNFPSDIAAGDALGRMVAENVTHQARTDESDAKGNITMPTGPGYWTGTNPLRPLWGKVRPCFGENISQLRPSPPPAFGSPEFNAALSEVRRISDNRTASQTRIAQKWADGAGTATPPGHWNQMACDLINSSHLSELRSARALALMNMAMMDAGICCWDTKYYYCLLRPWQADPKITTAVAKPNFPSYTSGHSAFSSAAAEVLSYIFPKEQSQLESMAEEAGISRLYGGIHYRFDIDNGQEGGRAIGRLAVEYGMADGSS